MVVAFPPGGSTDLAARALGEKLAAALGQPIVDRQQARRERQHRRRAVARSAPDGYTLLMAATSFATTPGVLPQASAGIR